MLDKSAGRSRCPQHRSHHNRDEVLAKIEFHESRQPLEAFCPSQCPLTPQTFVRAWLRPAALALAGAGQRGRAAAGDGPPGGGLAAGVLEASGVGEVRALVQARLEGLGLADPGGQSGRGGGQQWGQARIEA